MAPESSPDNAGGPVVMITDADIRLGEALVAPLPSGEARWRTGVDAEHKRHGAKDLLVTPLHEALKTWRSKHPKADSKATLIADKETPYRIIVEVLYTFGHSGVSEYDLLVISKKGEPPNPSPRVVAAPKTTKGQSAPSAGDKTLEQIVEWHAGGIRVLVSAEGFIVSTPAGRLAPGCGAETKDPAAVTIPKKQDGVHDFLLLTECAKQLKKKSPKDTLATLGAEAAIPYGVVVQTVDALRGTPPLFPDVQFAVPR
jgi:biopolymer transport protein ExbD